MRYRCALLSVLLFAGCDAEPEPTTPSASPAPQADEITAPKDEPSTTAIDVRPVTPEELQKLVAGNKGKAVLVDFWATWCIPCREQFPHTVALSKKHPDDLVVYSVSFDGDGPADPETLAGVKEFLGAHPGNVTNLISATGGDDTAYDGFEITGGALPHYKVFDREGNLATTFGGDVEEPIQPEQIDAAVAKAIGK